MWSLGCIVYELIKGVPIFPGCDENEMLEYFIVTLGDVPENMIRKSTKYNQFFHRNGNLRRSKKSNLPQKLVPGSEPIDRLLKGHKISKEMVAFIKHCLVIDPAKRMQP